jgi:hypothetical protein
MTLNFQSILKVPDVEDNPNRTLELFDIAEMIADKYGVHKVEFQHYHIPSTEPSYLKELRSRIEKSKSRMTQINLEFSGLNMSAPRVRDRLLAIDLTKMWVDHAAMLGAQRVMINQGAQGGTANVMPTHENKVYGIPTLKTMADYGKSKGIIVSVETRGGGGGGGRGGRAGGTRAQRAYNSSSAAGHTTDAAAGSVGVTRGDPERLWRARQCRPRWCGRDEPGRVAPVSRLLIPITAGSIHTRVNQRWDLATAIKFLEHDLGYKGLYTIEAGNGHEGTQPIYDVVVATL